MMRTRRVECLLIPLDDFWNADLNTILCFDKYALHVVCENFQLIWEITTTYYALQRGLDGDFYLNNHNDNNMAAATGTMYLEFQFTVYLGWSECHFAISIHWINVKISVCNSAFICVWGRCTKSFWELMKGHNMKKYLKLICHILNPMGMVTWVHTAIKTCRCSRQISYIPYCHSVMLSLQSSIIFKK